MVNSVCVGDSILCEKHVGARGERFRDGVPTVLSEATYHGDIVLDMLW